MKKMLALLCAAAMLLALVGCGAKNTPETVVGTFCDEMKNFNLEAMAQCVEDADPEDLNPSEEEVPSQLADLLRQNAQKITYTLSDATPTDDDEAVVEVSFQFPDVSKAVAAAMGEYLTQALGMAMSGSSEEDISKLFEQILVEKINSAEPATTEATVSFPCTKTEEGWKIEEVPNQVLNVMTRNFLAALDDLSKIME